MAVSEFVATGGVTNGDQRWAGEKAFAGGLAADTISEITSAAGVTIDGCTLKDNSVYADGLAEKTASNGIAVSSRMTCTDGVSGGTAKVIGGRSYALAAAGTAHTNSTDEAVLASFVIPANTIKAGTAVKVRYAGIASATNANDTLAVNLRVGPTTLTGTIVQAHAATDVADGDVFTGEFVLVGRAAPGAAAACVGSGIYNVLGAPGTAACTVSKLESTNFATNAALRVELTADWSAANAGNSCRADLFIVEVI